MLVRPLRHRSAAFTLIEILIVVAILAMLATVGAVQLTRARIVAREQLALMNLRTVAKACQFYNLTNQEYPLNLVTLGPTVSNPPYLDETLAQDPAVKQGYQFVYVRPDPTSFTLLANPAQHGATGIRHFLVDQTGTIHFTEADLDATLADPVIP